MVFHVKSPGRASLSKFGALGKFNSSGPQKLFMQNHAEASYIAHHWTIHMHAHTILILSVKGMVSYIATVCTLPFLQVILLYNTEIVFAIIKYMHDTHGCKTNHAIIFSHFFIL